MGIPAGHTCWAGFNHSLVSFCFQLTSVHFQAILCQFLPHSMHSTCHHLSALLQPPHWQSVIPQYLSRLMGRLWRLGWQFLATTDVRTCLGDGKRTLVVSFLFLASFLYVYTFFILFSLILSLFSSPQPHWCPIHWSVCLPSSTHL